MSKRWLVAMSAMAQLSCGGIFCIARGSKVKTPRGERNIEDLSVGDEVTVVDPVSLEHHVGKISEVRSAKRECARLNSLRLTSSHPLFDTDKNEWAPSGDWLLGARTHFASLDGPQKVEHVDRFIGIDDVYDLTIDHPLHTFVADGVVVHNKTPPYQPLPCRLADGTEVTKGESCSCGSSRGEVLCGRTVAICTCDANRDRWPGELGNSILSVEDFGRWEVDTCGAPETEALNVFDLNLRPPSSTTSGVLIIRHGACGLARSLGDEPVTPFSAQFLGGQRVPTPFMGFALKGEQPLSLYEVTDVDAGVQLSLSGFHEGQRVRFTAPTTLQYSRWYRLQWSIEGDGETVMARPSVFDDAGEVIGWNQFVMADGGTPLLDWYTAGGRFALPTDARRLMVGSSEAASSGGVILK